MTDTAIEPEPIDTQRVEEQLLETHRVIAASTLRMFELLAALDAAGQPPSSYPDAATWLAWNVGMSRRTSRRWVRMAHQLADLPGLRASFRSGVVSLEQLELLMRVVTPDTEAELVALAAEVGDVDGLRDEIRALQKRLRDEPDPSAEDSEPTSEPELRTWWADDSLHLAGSVPGSDGVMVEKALQRRAEQAPKNEATGLYDDYETRAGRALVELASASLGDDADHDRATVVVHVSAHDLATRSGAGWDAAGRIFNPAQLEELTCDARIQPALDSSGTTVGVGRTTRTIPPWLRRLVEGRDQHCRFPGCRRTRWLHIHHRIPWSQGGPTNLDNLVALCGHHHRLLHREKWTIVGSATSKLTFQDRWGRSHVPARARFPDGWERLRFEAIEHQAANRLAALAGAPP